MDSGISGGSTTQILTRFLICGFGLDIRTLSETLGLAPSESHRAGDADSSGNLYAHDAWAIAIPVPSTEPLDAHLKWIGEVLSARADFVRSMRGQAELAISCRVATDCEWGDLYASPRALKPLVDLGITLELDARLL